MADVLKLHFKKPGLFTTIQDGGRNGYQHLGIPVNGFMDRLSAQEANRLVGNDLNGPLLEITQIGPQIAFQGSGKIALTGADLSASINGKAMQMHSPISVKDGDLLRFSKPISGCRAYLAVAGSWQVKHWLGSACASAIQPAVLTPDSLIAKDSIIEIIDGKQTVTEEFSESQYHDFMELGDLKVIPGPEFSHLSNTVVASFFGQIFTISNDSNRMGYRLNETVKGFNPQTELISSGIIPGTIQLTNSGQPIILLADAQTSGGYTRIGNLTRESMDQLAQMRPGEEVRFLLAN